ncbi:MAG: ABC transporter permease [Clostridia bacterium]|nr:ABC transporter permease [Clostridia bacterium]
MKPLLIIMKRNIKLFFKDKGMLITSLITPLILLVLYATFLAQVYKDSFLSVMPAGVNLAESLIDGCVGGQLCSSLLAVCCITVAFCANMLMVQDKVTGARRDLTVSPVEPSKLALGYYLSTAIVTLIICLVATGACFLYMGKVGWYLSAADVLYLLLDVFLLVMLGTALSSVIGFFLSTQGQISAVGTVVSAGYGFICGAYMPISQFGEGLQKVLSFLPGTYGTALLRNHAMQGVFAEMEAQNIPAEAVDALRAAVDCEIRFFDQTVSLSAMYLILAGSVLALIIGYVLMNVLAKNK